MLGNGSLAKVQFNTGFTPISNVYPSTAPHSYVVNAGDTLQGIAAKFFGDASLAYLIAEANQQSLSAAALAATEVGKTYRIPNVIGNVHHNANTFALTDLASIFGNALPIPDVAAPTCSQRVGQISQVVGLALSPPP